MGPLSGYNVLDLSFYAPGRWACMALGDLGADVVCIEMPRGSRPGGYEVLDDDTHPRWFWYQRNKRSMTVNLKTPGGGEIFERLVRRADVVIESFKPGTAERLGVDYKTSRAINHRIVYCSVSGFGQSGPYRDLIGHEPNYQGLSGALGENRIDGGEPHVAPAIVGDIGGSNNALVSILAALLHRERSGTGQYIDVAITAGILPYLGLFPYSHWYPDSYRNVSVSSNLRPDFRAFRTSDGKYVSVSPGEPWLWRKFCAVIGRSDLADEFQATGERREWVVAELEDTFATQTRDYWTDLNRRENVSITAVMSTMAEVEADPQMIHRRMVQEVTYRPLGTVKQVGIPYQLSETPAEIRWVPEYGQHTEEILHELGFSEDQIDALKEAGTCEHRT